MEVGGGGGVIMSSKCVSGNSCKTVIASYNYFGFFCYNRIAHGPELGNGECVL